MNLSQLIKAHKGARSYAELSRDCGDYPSDKRLQQLATKAPKNFIDPPTVVALANGLRVPQVAVVLAVAESLGLDVERATPALLDRLPAGVDRLSDTQINAVAEVIRSLIEASESRSIPAQMREVISHLRWVGSDGRELQGQELSDSLDWMVERMLDGTRAQVASLANQFQILTLPGAVAVFEQMGISVDEIEKAAPYEKKEGIDSGMSAEKSDDDPGAGGELIEGNFPTPPEQEYDGYAGPEPDYGKIPADEPGTPSEGQAQREDQDAVEDEDQDASDT